MEKKFLDKKGLAELFKSFKDKFVSQDEFNQKEQEIYSNTSSELTGAFGTLSSQMQNKASKSDVPTKLSQLKEDDTHKVVTQEEKDTWNTKFDEKSDLGKNNVTFDCTWYDKPARHNKFIASIKKEESYTNTLKDTLSDQSEEIAHLMQAKQGAEFVATLDDNKKIPINQLPDEALKDTTYDLTPYVKKDEIKDLVGDVKPDLSEYAKKTEVLNKEKDRFNLAQNWRVTDLSGMMYRYQYVTPQSVMDIVDRMASSVNKGRGLREALKNKVDKIEGKDLSSNDYTSDEKTKLQNMPIPTFLEKEQYENLSEQKKMDNTKLYYTYVERQQ